MSRIMAAQTVDKVDESVTLKGWVQTRRDHGKLIFIDLRDASGIVQIVFWGGGDAELFAKASELRSEFVIEVTGKVQKRGEKQINPDIASGTVELGVETLTILNKSETPPFVLDDANAEVGEPTRLEYRYLDLRTERMQRNIRLRHKFIKEIRNYLDDKDFVEVETPILTKSSPEGARDFLVPSRLSEGKFYALPQAPQQFKQLLMVAGFERYYQIAHCFRDEDLRGDRQPEFTQLDLEMSFATQEDILRLNEDMFRTVINKVFPDKKVPAKFTRMTYDEAMAKYNSDKPDIREDKTDNDDLAFAWVTDFPVFEENEEGELTFAHNPFAAPLPEHRELLKSTDKAELLKMRAQCYDLVLNGYELSSGSIRIHEPELQKQVFAHMGLSQEQIDDRFGDFLKAFDYGAPPHGGMAPGLDRVLMILLEEPTIREVMAFPKNGDMRDLMLNSPSVVDKKSLKDLGL